MRKIFAALLACWFGVDPALADCCLTGYDLPSHPGPVASGAKLAQSYGDGFKSVGTHTDHVMRVKTSSIQVMFCNWSGVAEANNGASTTVKDALEYPLGTKTSFTFSGSTTGTIPAGGCLTSDSLTGVPPQGAQFWTDNLLNNSAGLAVNKNLDPTQGSGSITSTTVNAVADFTTGATPTLTSPGIGITETVIVGQTTTPSVGIAGDSRAHGLLFTAVNGDSGSLAAALGAAGLPVIDLGWSGETANNFNNGHTWRALILNTYATHVIVQHGFNDANIDQVNLATVQSRVATEAALFAGKTLFAVTWEPATSTTDNCASTANQSPLPTASYPNTEIDRLGWNSGVRAAPPSWAKAVFDVAAPVEGPAGKWLPAYSTDCIHPNGTGGGAVLRSGVVDVRQFYNVPVQTPVRNALPMMALLPAQFPPSFSISTSFSTSGGWGTIDPLGTSNLLFSRSGYMSYMVDSLFGSVYALYVRNFYGTSDLLTATATTQAAACGAAISGQTVTINGGGSTTGVCLQSFPSSSGFATRVSIANVSGSAKSIWPQTSGQIWNLNGSTAPLAVNAAASLANGSHATFECISATLCLMEP